MTLAFILGVLCFLSVHYREKLQKMFLIDITKSGRHGGGSSSSRRPSQSPSNSQLGLRTSHSRTSHHGSSTSSGASRSTAKPTPEEIEKLNKEFKEDIKKLERTVCDLPFREKSVATEWISRLKSVGNSSVGEMRARNEITAHLGKCMLQRVFSSPPFNNPPPMGSLEITKSKIPLSHNTKCMSPTPNDKKKYMSELYRNVYDKGEFLSQLPVPRDGAFFILHLRPQANNEESCLN